MVCRKCCFDITYFCVLFALYALPPVHAQDFSSIDFSSIMREMTAEEVSSVFIEEIKTNAPWNADEMEIVDIRTYPSRFNVPAGEIDFDVEMPSNGRYLGRISSLVTIKVDGRPVRRIRVTCRIEVYRNVFCAARSIRRGEMIDVKRDLEIVSRALSKLRGSVVSDPDDFQGMSASRSIRPGQVITSDMLTAPIVVERGNRVMIVAETPFINVRTPGVAMQKGAAGDLIKVRNIMSNRSITAMVVNSRSVRVLF